MPVGCSKFFLAVFTSGLAEVSRLAHVRETLGGIVPEAQNRIVLLGAVILVYGGAQKHGSDFAALTSYRGIVRCEC
jgi:hypothetical protein